MRGAFMMGRKRKHYTKGIDDDSVSEEPVISEDTDNPEEVTRQKFRQRFPNLTTELADTTSPSVRIDGVRWEETDRTQVTSTSDRSKFTGFSPDVIDFIRRCSTNQEVLEIIDFLEKRHEIDAAYAKALRQQLKRHGLRSFGTRKTWGHYEREG